MWFGLLGAFTVLNDSGEELDLGPPQRRELLAFLLSNSNRPVSVDSIIDALWPSEPPTAVRTSIQSHISRLRTTLGPERIVTRSPGYQVRVAVDTFDVLEFLQSVQDGQRLAGNGSHRSAFEELARGLSLWRGEPFWDFSYSDWAQLEISHLETMRQAAVRERFDLALTLGLHDEMLPELATASDRAPGDEDLLRLHATALYRSGRQQEALDRLAALRKYMVEELGLDPSPKTDDLELAILRHDSLLTVPQTDHPAAHRSLHGEVETSSAWADDIEEWPEVEVFGFDELGEIELLGMTGPQQMWTALDPSSPRFDLIRVSRRLSNLPAPLTSFVGRTEELADLEALVRTRRLVTVTGPAGVGKTRLALQVARDLAGDLADGVWVVELASVDDPDLIPVMMLEAMGVNRGEGKATEFLLDVVEDRQLLLLVDNCEHLIDAAADLVESVLKRASGVKVLATSREPLGIPGEFLHPVAPLNVPDVGHMSRSDELEDTVDAIGLFLERARAVAPVVLDEVSAPLVAGICGRLDGLPLALELAAAQLDHLALDELSVLLEAELSGLESPYRATPTRQRTIQAAVEWSYRLLTPLEQAVFRRLAVFTGDFDREAAQSVCGFSRLTGDVIPLLDRLVKRSLLVRLPGGRYRLLQVLRHAAIEELRQAGEEDALTAAHAGYYLQQATEALTYTRRAQQVEWIRRLDLDWPNIRTALHWAIQHDPEQGARAVIGLTDYFRVDHGWEGMEWTNHYLDSIDDRQIVLELHRTRALAAMISSVHDIMVESAEYIISHSVDGDDDVVGDALVVLAMKAVETTDSSSIAQVRARMEGVGLETPRALRRQASIEAIDHLLRGDLEGAAEWIRRSLDLIPLTGEVWGTVGTSSNLADVMMRLGRLDEALSIVDEAVAAGRELGARVMLAFSMITRAEILYRMGHFPEGLESALEGLTLAHHVSSRFEVTSGAEVAAALLLNLGRMDDAAALHSFSHTRAEGWGQEGLLSQFSLYHEDLVAGLEGLPAEQMDRAACRGDGTPLPTLIEQISIESAPAE